MYIDWNIFRTTIFFHNKISTFLTRRMSVITVSKNLPAVFARCTINRHRGKVILISVNCQSLVFQYLSVCKNHQAKQCFICKVIYMHYSSIGCMCSRWAETLECRKDGNSLNFTTKLPKERLATIQAKDIEGHFQKQTIKFWELTVDGHELENGQCGRAE